jgi:hypothetical protein
MLYCLNKNIVNEWIMITLRNWSLKDKIKSLMIFLIFRESWQVVKYYTWCLNINQSIDLFNLFNLFLWFLFGSIY